MKHIIISAFLLVIAAQATRAQDAYEPYAEEVLQAEAKEEVEESTGCAQVSFGGQETLTTSEAQALLCMAVKQLPLALSVMEYGSADRAEVLVGALLQTGVPAKALGRMATFYENDNGKHTVADPYHGNAFYQSWQLVFGNEFARKIRLEKGGQERMLDVDGTISWKAGYVAPTLWIRNSLDEEPQLRVLDPLLSPDKIVSPEAWKQLQNVESAALIWGAVENVPVLMTESLPPEALLRLKRYMNIPANEPLDAEDANRFLREATPELRAEIEAEILDIADKSPWHPQNWNEYALNGELKQAGGSEVPALHVEREDSIQQRIEAALANLELIQAYHSLRKHYASDEEFLQEVKRRMLANSKKPKEVVINFDE